MKTTRKQHCRSWSPSEVDPSLKHELTMLPSRWHAFIHPLRYNTCSFEKVSSQMSAKQSKGKANTWLSFKPTGKHHHHPYQKPHKITPLMSKGLRPWSRKTALLVKHWMIKDLFCAPMWFNLQSWYCNSGSNEVLAQSPTFIQINVW